MQLFCLENTFIIIRIPCLSILMRIWSPKHSEAHKGFWAVKIIVQGTGIGVSLWLPSILTYNCHIKVILCTVECGLFSGMEMFCISIILGKSGFSNLQFPSLFAPYELVWVKLDVCEKTRITFKGCILRLPTSFIIAQLRQSWQCGHPCIVESLWKPLVTFCILPSCLWYVCTRIYSLRTVEPHLQNYLYLKILTVTRSRSRKHKRIYWDIQLITRNQSIWKLSDF